MVAVGNKLHSENNIVSIINYKNCFGFLVHVQSCPVRGQNANLDVVVGCRLRIFELGNLAKQQVPYTWTEEGEGGEEEAAELLK